MGLEENFLRVRTERDEAIDRSKKILDAAEMLWVVIANVSGGNWAAQSSEWQEAAARCRDHYFSILRKEVTDESN